MDDQPPSPPVAPPLVVRPSGGANCSSVGSVVDLLFVAGTLGGALLVAVTAALDDLSLPASEGPPAPPLAPDARAETPAEDLPSSPGPGAP